MSAGQDANTYCWVTVQWFVENGRVDEETECKEFELRDDSSRMVDTFSPDYLRGHVHMVHKCQWLPVDGTGIGTHYLHSLRTTATPAPCEMQLGRMVHNPGNTKYLRNKFLHILGHFRKVDTVVSSLSVTRATQL